MFEAFAAPIDLSNTFQPAGLFGDFGELFSDIILVLTMVAGAVSFIFVIIAGIRFITSGGDEKGLASARAALMYAIIGFGVTVLAFIIIRVVQFFIGSDVPIT